MFDNGSKVVAGCEVKQSVEAVYVYANLLGLTETIPESTGKPR